MSSRDEIFGLTLPLKLGRLMMNLRGLVLDDPEHTVHLQTLQFAARDTEIEEA
jgi:hypothetical protein